MKRFFAMVALAALPAFTLNAQANTFKKGDRVASLIAGFGTASNLGSATLPPLTLAVDWGVKDNLFGSEKISLGLGAFASYASSKSNGLIEWTSTRISVGGRATVHFQLVKKLDLYWAGHLGYRFASLSAGGSSLNVSGLNNGLAWSTSIGGRYYFTDKWAANLELGYGIASAQVGVSYKF